MNWQQIVPFLYRGQDIALMVHERPDGDALGSAMGLGLVLRQLGMNPRLLRPRPIDQVYRFLPGQDLVEIMPVDGLKLPKDGAVMVFDCGDMDRCEYSLGNKKPLVNIDHHISNPNFGVLNWVNPKAAATSEVIWGLLSEAGIPISSDAATCLYTALATDTGWFRYDNVTAYTMMAAADLIRQGADLRIIRHELLENRPKQELNLIKEVMNRLMFAFDDQVIYCSLPYALLTEKEIMVAETDNALELMRGTKGVEVTVLIKETEPDVVKLSIRTKTRINASEMAQQLGGGGHIRAAGCTYYGSLSEAEQKILAVLKEILD